MGTARCRSSLEETETEFSRPTKSESPNNNRPKVQANEDRIILKHGLLFKKHYGETGGSKYYQILIPN